MKTSNNIDQRDQLYALLVQVPEVVDLFAKRETTATERWFAWLHNAEQALKDYSHPECAQLAGLRATITAAQLSHGAARSHRRYVDEVCISTINPAQQVVLTVYSSLNSKLEAAYTLFRQILVPMRANNLIALGDGQDMTDFINTLLKQLSLNEQLSASINGVIASIGKADTMRVIAEILTE